MKPYDADKGRRMQWGTAIKVGSRRVDLVTEVTCARFVRAYNATKVLHEITRPHLRPYVGDLVPTVFNNARDVWVTLGRIAVSSDGLLVTLEE
jgi:hypothetical protein